MPDQPTTTEYEADLAELRQKLLDREAEAYAPGTDEMGEALPVKAIGNPDRPQPTEEDLSLLQWEIANNRPGISLADRPPPDPVLLYTDGEIREPALRGDVGYDLLVKQLMWIPASSFARVPLEAKVAIPYGYWGLVIARSSANKEGRLFVFPGVIDAGYRGPLFAFVQNLSEDRIALYEGMSICQLILIPAAVFPTVSVPMLPVSERGARGFGSTGVNKVE
jgi:deoxyuridine 5'-triphosphate nucleotidohydrolase